MLLLLGSPDSFVSSMLRSRLHSGKGRKKLEEQIYRKLDFFCFKDPSPSSSRVKPPQGCANWGGEVGVENARCTEAPLFISVFPSKAAQQNWNMAKGSHLV